MLDLCLIPGVGVSSLENNFLFMIELSVSLLNDGIKIQIIRGRNDVLNKWWEDGINMPFQSACLNRVKRV